VLFGWSLNLLLSWSKQDMISVEELGGSKRAPYVIKRDKDKLWCVDYIYRQIS